MWSSSLARQLLWEVKVKMKPASSSSVMIPDYIMPSWSWLSVDTEISLEERYWNHSLIEIIDFQYDTRTANPYGRIKGASLRVRALTKAIFLVTKPSPFTDHAYDFWAHLGLEKGESLYAEGSKEVEENGIGYRICNSHSFYGKEDRQDARDTRHYLCMLAAVSQHDKSSRRELVGLLLEPTGEADHFRRVGLITLNDECALKIRYKIDDDDPFKNKKSRELWEKVAPNWTSSSDTGEESRVSPEDIGSLSLYELDAGEDVPFEKLVPRDLVLV